MLIDVKSKLACIRVAGAVLVLLLFAGDQHTRAQMQGNAWPSIGPNIPSASAQDVWQPIGPPAADGGQAYGLAIDPRTPSTLYAGMYGGVYKSTDGGRRWFGVNLGLPVPLGPVYVVAVDPQTPGTIYASITTADPFNIYEPSGRGVYKSENGGNSWAPANAGLVAHVHALAVDPRTPATLYALAGSPPCCSDRLYKSTDAGGSWLPLKMSSNALLVDPQSADTLYVCSAGNALKSTDAGATWVTLRNGGCGALAVDPQTPSTVYLSGQGLFKSTDSGATWTQLSDLNARDLVIDPQTPSTIYAGTGAGGVFKSDDGGVTWRSVFGTSQTARFITTLAIDPRTPSTLYLGSNPGGMFRTQDGGSMWAAANTGIPPYRAMFGLAVDPQTPSRLYASDLLGQVYKSVDEGGEWSASLRTTIYTFAFDPQNSATVYAGGFRNYKSTDAGDTWTPLPAFPGFFSIAVDPVAPSTIYGVPGNGFSQRPVLKSVDGGSAWTQISSFSARVLVLDPFSPSTIYAAGSSGLFKSIDGGSTWVAANNGLTNAYLLALSIDPQNPSVLYAGGSLVEGRAGFGEIFKSTDGGNGWSAVGLRMPNVNVNALSVDPHNPATVYAGSSDGVLKSTDAGVTWTTLNDGLTNRVVWSLALNPQAPTRLYAGTSGGGVFAITMTTRYPLTAERQGDGGGLVTSTPAGIECGADCSEMYAKGATVALHAVAAADSVFTGWRDCDEVGDDGTCTVTMDRSRTVTAGFDLKRYRLTVSASRGTGMVTSSPGGIDCGSACSEVFVIGTTVTLTATPEHGVVKDWSGCDTDSGHGRVSTCTVTMTADRAVTATFTGPPASPASQH